MKVFVCHQTIIFTKPLYLSTRMKPELLSSIDIINPDLISQAFSCLVHKPCRRFLLLEGSPPSPYTCSGLLPVDFYHKDALVLIGLLLWRGFCKFQSWSIWHKLVHGALASCGLFEEFAFLLETSEREKLCIV